MADDASGKATHLGGRIKEGIADLLGDRELKRDALLDQEEGIAEQDAARAKDDLREAELRRLEAQRAKRI
jgi:uncharacterized protein YjbJ (UPF0337 family)